MRRRIARLPERWSNAPLAIVAIVGLLLLAGIAVIFQNEAAYRDLQQQEARVQAEILAASVTGALHFNDAPAPQEAGVAVRFQRSGCIFSIIASVVLTLVLNLALRAC